MRLTLIRDGEKINLFSFDFAFCAKTRNTWTRRAQKAKSSEKENRFISVKLLRAKEQTFPSVKLKGKKTNPEKLSARKKLDEFMYLVSYSFQLLNGLFRICCFENTTASDQDISTRRQYFLSVL